MVNRVKGRTHTLNKLGTHFFYDRRKAAWARFLARDSSLRPFIQLWNEQSYYRVTANGDYNNCAPTGGGLEIVWSHSASVVCLPQSETLQPM